MLLNLSEHFSKLADMECPPASPDPNAAECIGRFVHYAESYNLQFGWLKAMLYLALWVPIYGGYIYWRRRRNGSSLPNKSLGRTRDR
jgi:hypothetical protein